MPMCDAYIPVDALTEEAEQTLLARVTHLLIEHEGVDPANPYARSFAWVFLHRHEMYVGGAPTDVPHYRFVCHVPEGQYSSARRAAITAEITEAVAIAEAGARPDPDRRVWVFTHEVRDGSWGGFGRVVRLPDIAEAIGLPREPAEQAIAARRRKDAARILAAAADAPEAAHPAS